MHCTIFLYSEWNAFLAHSRLLFLFYPYKSLSLFLFKGFKTISMAPKRKLNRSTTKFEKGETSRSPIQETPTPIIPSPLNSLEVAKHWFENNTAFGRWINTFKIAHYHTLIFLTTISSYLKILRLALHSSNQLPVSRWILVPFLTLFW